MQKQKLAFFIFIFGLFLPLSYVSAGTVLSAHKYAWSDYAGYINFENVVVGDSSLSGYAWSSNYGWINFSPTQGGVLNDGAGNLTGSAWGAQLGWIDFNNVSINPSTGKFSGTASGSLAGTVNFDCPNYCDVMTDWRQAAAAPVTPVPVVSSDGGGIMSYIQALTIPPKIDALNVPLVILPQQSGTLTKDSIAGKIIVEVPAGSVASKTTFTIGIESLTPANSYLVVNGVKLINGLFYDISAQDQDGNYIHFFENPITIILPLPANLTDFKNLSVYWLNETNWQWVLIPDAVFTHNKVTFWVNYLAKFAIFASMSDVINLSVSPLLPSLPLPPEKKPIDKNDSLIPSDSVSPVIKVPDEIGSSDAVTYENKIENIRRFAGNNIRNLILVVLIIWLIFFALIFLK